MNHPHGTPATPEAGTTGDHGTPNTPDTPDTPAADGTTPASPADTSANGNRAGGKGDTGGGPAREGNTPGTEAPLPHPAHTPPAELRDQLATRLGETARSWFEQALAEAAAHPGRHGPISVWELRLAEAGRRCGPANADAVRVLILHAARAGTDALTRVYFQGTADERRAVLHALPHLVTGPDALPLVEDALRTNDTRLLAAALGPYAARHLDAHAWRHAVLKCLFTGVPVDHVADLERRASGDAELARMLRDYAAERTAAGRPVPDDLHRVLALTESAAVPDREADTPHGKES
ncbi:EboA domain-containing protein [Streptomyces thermocarboxydovorans]|uniref:EboA domain-containing protein n=1 Tax=Streptomyces thermocarboxydovorans TaxID=59298 RepID=A0ABN1HIN3_9ACTN